jgi:tripeptide aminopeptidase
VCIPGFAKDKMINATLVAHKLISMLPPTQRPEHTEKYEGFYHLMSLNGNVEKAEMQLIIRDHDKQKFEKKKKLLIEIVQSSEYGVWSRTGSTGTK